MTIVIKCVLFIVLHWDRPPPPWTDFLTHATENITLPQSSFEGGKNGAFTTLSLYSHRQL